MKSMIRLLSSVLVLALIPGAVPSQATAETNTDSAPAISCRQLGTIDLTGLPEAPTRILAATPVAATPQKAAYCQVKGYVSPQVQFEVRLPSEAWSGRYLQLGCGGFCGFADPDDSNHRLPGNCAPPDDGKVVIGADNSGHIGASSVDGLWAHSDPQLRVFGQMFAGRLAVVGVDGRHVQVVSTLHGFLNETAALEPANCALDLIADTRHGRRQASGRRVLS